MAQQRHHGPGTSGDNRVETPAITDRGESMPTTSDESIEIIPVGNIQAQEGNTLTRVMSPSHEEQLSLLPQEIPDDRFYDSLHMVPREQFCMAMMQAEQCPLCKLPVMDPVICANCHQWGHLECLQLAFCGPAEAEGMYPFCSLCYTNMCEQYREAEQ